MNLAHVNALITGAAGGIGATVARAMVERGAVVLLTDQRADALARTTQCLRELSLRVDCVAADITSHEDRALLAARSSGCGVNTLINLAGISPFGLLTEQDPARIELAVAINTTAPILLCQRLLPWFSTLPEAHIVNVGSMLGAIAMPGYCAYGATKSALQNFSEALRRETTDSNVRVHYVAPRATRTPLNPARVCEMNEELGIRMDDPGAIADAIINAIVRDKAVTYIGLPERVYRILNALIPWVIDKAVHKQLPIIKRFASTEPTAESVAATPAHAVNR